MKKIDPAIEAKLKELMEALVDANHKATQYQRQGQFTGPEVDNKDKPHRSRTASSARTRRNHPMR